MRSFYIACAILLAIITLIIFNSCWVTSKIERLLTLCEAIESKSAGDDADVLLEQLLSARKIPGNNTQSLTVRRHTFREVHIFRTVNHRALF